MSFTRMKFEPDDGLRSVDTYPATPTSEDEAREQIQGRLDELKDYINDKLLSELAEVTTGASGADYIGSAAISGVDGTTVRNQISSLKAQLTTATMGGVGNGSITDAMLANDVKVGSLAALTTSNKSNVVTAINELKALFGILSELTTTAKTLVGAINELNVAKIPSSKIEESAVTEGKIMTDAVTETKIRNGSVTADKIAASTITAAQLAANAVDTTQIKNGAVNGDKLAANAVTEGKIANYNVTKDKIADGNVMKVKLGSDVPQILYGAGPSGSAPLGSLYIVI